MSTDEAQKAVADHGFWYHSMELAPGVETRGYFDLRPVVDRLPWPDVRGKRCLDVGPYDGFLSFELERRGAAEVIAADISSPEEWDWAYRDRRSGPREIAESTGSTLGLGLNLAKEVRGSSVERVDVSIYDLRPERVGRFDVVVCGSLLLHLRDPFRGIEAIRSVCTEYFMSCETIHPILSVTGRRKPMARLRGGERCQWWIPNVAGHLQMLESAGFDVVKSNRPYVIPLGVAHPGRRTSGRPRNSYWEAALGMTGCGVPHAAALCEPAAQKP